MAYNMYGQTGWNPQMANPSPYYQQAQSYGMPVAQNAPVPQRPVFVDGEMAARVFQMPENWPVNVPLYLWDSNGDYFYIKMIGPNGVPMPLQKFYYQKAENEAYGYISGNGSPQVDTSQFVTKDTFERQMNELKEMMRANQNNQQNRGVKQ